ncbi:Uncharacterised protein [BD1-7 clade bacterium]|nr:Uncharacterised protein [BD1-7 clade bacterium]
MNSKKHIKTLTAATLSTLAIAAASMATAHTPDSKMIAYNDIQWQQLGNTPMQFAVMWGDREHGANGTYLKLPAGFETGVHGHSHDYNGITLQGTWEHKIDGQWQRLPPGSYVSQVGGEFHNDRCTGKVDCVLLIQQDQHSDVLFPAAK